MPANAAINDLFGNADVTMGLLAPSTTLTEDVAKTSQRIIYDDLNKTYDVRLYENFNTESGCIAKYVYRDIDVSTTGSKPVASYTSKYTAGQNSTNWIIYRLTDIMLLKAEAICQKLQVGSDAEIEAYNAPLLEEAFTLVNAVNKRSVCQSTLSDTLKADNYKSKGLMEELVLKERQRELMFEGKRWYDLVRRSMRDGNTDVLTAAAGRRDGINSQYVQSFFGSTINGMYAIFWPYNDEETKVNLNLAAQQNPAFGTGESNIQK
jgi:hypothetical protein